MNPTKILNTISDVLESINIEKGIESFSLEEDVRNIMNNLPDDILYVARQWGANDTVFRDSCYDWILQNIYFDETT